MDKQLHQQIPLSVHIKKLDTQEESANGFLTFLYEPKNLVPFSVAWDWQKYCQDLLVSNPNAAQAVWLLEHSSCYTLGRGASEQNLHFHPLKPPAPLFRIDRGGEVTHHLPGQLVVYPVLDLKRYKTDLNWYLRQLELVVLDIIHELGLKGKQIEGLTGIWIEDKKVAAIGISCKRWITQHGLAINVNCDLSGFKQIIPCGLKDRSVGRLDYFVPGLKVAEIKPLIKKSLSFRFGLTWDTQNKNIP